ncbi:MAG: penicillin acylase family protein [Cyclobacteriaceae bacterium]|nr:penicillin acylase family protein [Cyclobacteriaceae bacterium]MDH5250275.1 penicillin acylase family protein [Cyclobacteriaceae bacterium]
MRGLKFIISLSITLGLIYLLDNRWVVGEKPIPPIGRFLDPFNGFWRNIEANDFMGPSTLDIKGLKENVTVVYDSLSIPHIFADNDMDLYFAQGYITAMHRLWQMEFQTHAAAGRVSEITGAGANDMFLEYDRGQRRLGMVFAAQNSMASLAGDQNALLIVEKYSEGINAFIKTLQYKTLPFEYKLLDYRPEPWSPLKCALLQKSMEQTLCMGDKDMEMTNALKLFGWDVVELLYPDHESVGDPIVEKINAWNFSNNIPDTIPIALPEELLAVRKLPGIDPTIGSNNWAVSGTKTASGSPILCGDPHLSLSLPSIWFAIQLKAPGINTMGVSLPGAPGVIIGCTDSIAWSITNAQRDLVDWFAITFQDHSRTKYLLDSQWVDTKKVIERFKVRGKPVFEDTLLYTYWGPIPYDENYHATNNLKGYAFRWISHDPFGSAIAFYKLNRAQNYADFMEALNYFDAPASNFAFASAAGDIAMRVQGKYPMRRPMEGKFVLDGSKSANGWFGFIPNDQNINDKNPARGFVSSANQYPVDDTYPYYITATSFEAYRNRRINKILGGLNNIQPADMMKLQNDNYNLKAEESLPFFLNQLDTTAFSQPEKEAFQLLSSWDYFNTKDAEAASYYEAWWDNLMALIWDELDGKDINLIRPTTFNTIKLLQDKPNLSFFDIQSTPEKEDARSVIQKGFSIAVSSIAGWKEEHANVKAGWADYKDGYIGHLMRLEPLGIHVKTGGNHDIINANSRTKGPSWRMIVSLEKTGVKMWGVYPGGQSGNPGSKHYTDMVDHWANGEYYPLLFLHKPEDARERQFYTTQLKRQR